MIEKYKKELPGVKFFEVNEIEKNGLYRTYVGDIVKVTKIDHVKKEMTLFNVSQSCNLYKQFRYVDIIERIR